MAGSQNYKGGEGSVPAFKKIMYNWRGTEYWVTCFLLEPHENKEVVMLPFAQGERQGG